MFNTNTQGPDTFLDFATAESLIITDNSNKVYLTRNV